MPIRIPEGLPAIRLLEQENIFLMNESRAQRQDIRPLKILILNLMPTKIETETQLLRLLSNTPLQVEVELLTTGTHISKNTPPEYLLQFYKKFSEVRGNRYDGMIITGAPVEQIGFEDVDYWPELCRIMEWTRFNVYSTLHICWGAQAGLYYHNGVGKHELPQKLSGIYPHRVINRMHPLLRGFDDVFSAPHSRYTGVNRAQVEADKRLLILADSPEADLYLIADVSGRRIYVTGHAEYDRDTLAGEYTRDIGKGLAVPVPGHYFPGDDPAAEPVMTWRSHANLLFANWLNYFVYQLTPFNLAELAPNTDVVGK